MTVISDDEIPEIPDLNETALTDEADSERNVETADVPETKAAPSNTPEPFEAWADVLSELSKAAPLMAAVLDGSSAYVKDDILLIDCQNEQFFQFMRSEEPVYREQIRNAVNTVVGRTFRLGPYKKAAPEPEDPLQNIIEKLKSLEVPGSEDQ